MANNKRIFYACRRAGIAPASVGQLLGGVPSFQTIRGLQSIGLTTTFRLEQIFETGQLAIYDNIEGIPDVEATLEKVLDGYSPIYCLATNYDIGGNPATAATLAGRANGYCILGIQVYDETLSITGYEGIAQSGAASAGLQTEVHMSGMYTSSIRYQAAIERSVTESVTLVGNNKAWVVGADRTGWNSFTYGGGRWDTPWTSGIWTSGVSGTYPASYIGGSGGVQRREDLIMDTAGRTYFCVLPYNIPGITQSGTSPTGTNIVTSGTFGAHVQSWNVHVDLGREQLNELGRKGAYYRYINWPIEVVNEIGIIGVSGDMISCTEEGIYGSLTSCGSRYNLIDYAIRLALCEGLVVDCGVKNKLRSVGMTGGDTGRGNVELTYTYANFNDFTVKHPRDPVSALRP